MAEYTQERRVFNRLQSDITDTAKHEFEDAFNILIAKYNTTIRENRFLTGGAIEVFICALLRTVGIECNLYGSQATDGDIILPNNKMLSVKSAFTGGVTNITLINKQGSGIRRWKTATLFVFSEVGIVYGAPNMVNSHFIKDGGDAVLLQKKALLEIVSNNNNVIPMELNKKPATEMAGLAERASIAVAKQILFDTRAINLLKAYNIEL